MELLKDRNYYRQLNDADLLLAAYRDSELAIVLAERMADGIETEEKHEAELEQTLKSHEAKLSELDEKVYSLEMKIQQLEEKLNKEQAND